MIKAWFDTKYSLSNTLCNLETLHEIIKARAEVKRNNSKIVLNEFIIAGVWLLDKFGQVFRINEVYDSNHNQLDHHQQITYPLIVTLEEFSKMTDGGGYSASVGGTDSYPPPAYQRCPVCNKQWTLRDSGDVYRYFDATSSDGKSVFYHKKCYQDYVTKCFMDNIVNVFKFVNINVFGIIRTDNLYESTKYRGHWLIIDTEYGHFTIGWRNSVMNVDYSKIDIHYLPNTEQTRGPGFEHVYTYADLQNALIMFKDYLHNKAK